MNNPQFSTPFEASRCTCECGEDLHEYLPMDPQVGSTVEFTCPGCDLMYRMTLEFTEVVERSGARVIA